MMKNKTSFDVHILGGGICNASDDNVDVEVRLSNGKRYSATFFTLKNLATLFEKNKETGECSQGTYLWASDMILVEELSLETIKRTVEGLLKDEKLDSAFALLEECI